MRDHIGLTLLERRIHKLRLVAMRTMYDSVKDFYDRIPSHSGCWSPGQYPTRSEKELYAKFAHILLWSPNKTIPALLELFGTPSARKIRSRVLDVEGSWSAYRVSTVRRDLGTRWKKERPADFSGCLW